MCGRVVALILLLLPISLFAQETGQIQKKERKGEFYFSWGYNTEWYTRSNLRIRQPGLDNDFTLKNITGHDHPGWNEQFFTKAITIPQYNYRMGYIFNKKKGLGVEINFDHTKYILTDGEMVHIVGKIGGKSVDTHARFKDYGPTGDSTSWYYLNNGANFLLFNITKRWHLLENKSGSVRLDGFGKFGLGPVIPHVDNRFFGQPANEKHFQFGGWNVGVEGTLRATFFHYVFLEYMNKLDYARYSGLKIYKGTAKQAFGTYEMNVNLGVTFPVGKKMQ